MYGLGLIATLIGVIGAIPYIYNTYRRKIKLKLRLVANQALHHANPTTLFSDLQGYKYKMIPI